MQAPYATYGAPPAPAVDQYRQPNLANGSPIQPPTSQMPQIPTGQPPYAPPGFGVGLGGYSYGNMGGMQSMAYMPQDQSNNRRGGRVRDVPSFRSILIKMLTNADRDEKHSKLLNDKAPASPVRFP